MTEIEIATGAAIAAQGAVHCARHTCHNANAPLLDEAYNALELAVSKLIEAKVRAARMIEP